jgi:hypothetical protein
MKVGRSGTVFDTSEKLLGLGVSAGWAACFGSATGAFVEEFFSESGFLCAAVSLLAPRELRTFLLAATAACLAKRVARVEVMRRRWSSGPDLSTGSCNNLELTSEMRSEAMSANATSSKTIAESSVAASPHGFATTSGSHGSKHSIAHSFTTSFVSLAGFLLGNMEAERSYLWDTDALAKGFEISSVATIFQSGRIQVAVPSTRCSDKSQYCQKPKARRTEVGSLSMVF